MDLFNFLKDKRILIAEDEPYNQDLMSDIFEDAGCYLHIVGNGLEAINKYQEEEFDLILMDVQMPTMDGYDATEEIRRIEENQSISRTPILAITANVLLNDRERCFKAGMDEYLPKPIKIHDLKNKLYRLLNL